MASAFDAANTLLELTRYQALSESETRNSEELAKLKESYGSIGSKLAAGGSKALKELDKEHKTRETRLNKDFMELALIDINSQLVIEAKQNISENDYASLENSSKKIQVTTEALKCIGSSFSLKLTVEKMFVQFISY